MDCGHVILKKEKKNMEITELTTLEVNQIIREKANENEEFRLALLNDPKSVFEKEFGVIVPEDINIQVHLENSKVLHLIIPATNADELSDEELEGVAGGTLPSDSRVITTLYAVYSNNKESIWRMNLKDGK